MALSSISTAEISTISARDISIAVTESNTVVISIQVQKTTNLSDGVWSDIGEPLLWEDPIHESEFYRVQSTGVQEMDIYTPENTANLKRVILWQYEKAERLKALIQYQQDFFDDAVTDFWDSYRNDTFDLDTADSFGLRVWGIMLGVDRPFYDVAYPEFIEVVGAGTSSANDAYTEGGTNNDRPTYINSTGDGDVFFGGVGWQIKDDAGFTIYSNTSTAIAPPKTGWTVGTGSSPAPTLEYTLVTPFTDEMYRQLLKSRLMLMRMTATIPNINRYIEFLFPNNSVAVTDGLNMTISYRFLKPLTLEEQAVLSVDGVLPHPAGVEAIQIIVSGETNFGFEGQYRDAADSGTQLSNFDNSTFIEE